MFPFTVKCSESKTVNNDLGNGSLNFFQNSIGPVTICSSSEQWNM